MSTKNEPISRRTLLRGAGTMLALPFLEAMLPKGAFAGGAAARPPLRMGIVSVTGGTVLESWKPAAAGPLTKLPSILRPLEFANDDLLVLSGLSQQGRSENLNAHEHCACLHLTGADSCKREGGKLYAGVSVDQLVAQKIGDRTFLPSLEIGLNSNRYSFRDSATALPYEGNPRFVFERMFRGRSPVVPNWRRRAGMPTAPVFKSSGAPSGEQSVMDLVRDQARALRRQLGRADQDKLDGYLDSVRSVETRLGRLEARLAQERLDAAHPGPSQLITPHLYPEGTSFGKVQSEIDHDPDKHGEYIEIMSDLMVLAFQTDTTRVAVFSAGSDDAHFPGVVTVGYETHCHTLEHNGNAARVDDADPIAREACRQIHAWYTGLFARMMRKMKDIDEGGSSLLDNSMILFTSYMADGGHGTHDYPVMLAGKAGGTLKTGRHIALPDDTPMASLYMEMLDRMGVRVNSFGNSRTSKNATPDGRLHGLA